MATKKERREQKRWRSLNQEITERIGRAVPNDGHLEFFPGLILTRISEPSETFKQVFDPAFCLIAQGSKKAQLGNEIFHYDPEHYMIHTVEVPMIFRIDEATAEMPYLGFRLILDSA